MSRKPPTKAEATITTRLFAPAGNNKCRISGCEAKYYGSGYCKKHHQWHWKRGLLPRPQVITIEDKLRSYSKVDETTGCWIWKKGKNNKGYGTVAIGGDQKAYAHRVSYEIFKGKLPDGLEACHKCDTPACINPDHLFPGTHKDNMEDSAKKGRAKQPPIKFGVRHPRAAFTTEQVRFIRQSSSTVEEISAALGAKWATVYRCKRRETYKDVA